MKKSQNHCDLHHHVFQLWANLFQNSGLRNQILKWNIFQIAIRPFIKHPDFKCHSINENQAITVYQSTADEDEGGGR